MSSDGFDRELGAWLEAEAPPLAPDGLHQATITLVRSTRQVPRWIANLRAATSGVWARQTRPFGRTAFSVLVIVGLLLALAFAAISLGNRTPVFANGLIAFSAWDEPPSNDSIADRDIYLVDLGVPARRIIGSETDGLDQVCPAVSPDGRHLAFGQGRLVTPLPRETWRDATLEVVELDAGGDPTPSRSLEVGAFPLPCPVWSPDGQRLAFSVPLTSPINPTRSSTGSAVWIVTLADGQVTVVPDMLAIDLDWSPDGGQLAIASGREAGNGREMQQDSLIHLYSVASGSMRSLPETLGVAQFSWSPHGPKIAFDATGDPRLRVIDVDTGRIETLASGFRAWNGPQPAWSPTADRIAYLRNPDCSECSEVVLVDPRSEQEGAAPEAVLTTPGDLTRPGGMEELSATDRTRFWSAYRISWSPDGAYVLYHAERAVESVFRFALVAVPVDPDKPPVVLVDDVADDMWISAIDSDSYVPIQAWGRRPSEVPNGR